MWGLGEDRAPSCGLVHGDWSCRLLSSENARVSMLQAAVAPGVRSRLCSSLSTISGLSHEPSPALAFHWYGGLPKTFNLLKNTPKVSTSSWQSWFPTFLISSSALVTTQQSIVLQSAVYCSVGEHSGSSWFCSDQESPNLSFTFVETLQGCLWLVHPAHKCF